MSGQSTLPDPDGSRAVVIRSDEVEVLDGPSVQIRLLADSSAIAGALSTQRVTLTSGSGDAAPAPGLQRAVRCAGRRG